MGMTAVEQVLARTSGRSTVRPGEPEVVRANARPACRPLHAAAGDRDGRVAGDAAGILAGALVEALLPVPVERGALGLGPDIHDRGIRPIGAAGVTHERGCDADHVATEVGVTSSTIRIAVIADVDNAFAPGLFKGAVDGVKAAAKYLNSKAGGGGIAGRKLVVDFYDSKLEPNESRNATITACQNDLAMVGTSAVVLNTVDDIVNCPNRAGDPVGIPDVSSLTATIAQSCSPVSFPIVGVSYVCSTMNDNPQTYYGNQGEAKYLLSKLPVA